MMRWWTLVVVVAYLTLLYVLGRAGEARAPSERVEVRGETVVVTVRTNANTEIWLDGRRLTPADLSKVDPHSYTVDDMHASHGLLFLGLVSRNATKGVRR